MPEQTQRQLTFVDALREGLDQAMAADSKVIVIGEGCLTPRPYSTRPPDCARNSGRGAYSTCRFLKTG